MRRRRRHGVKDDGCVCSQKRFGAAKHDARESVKENAGRTETFC